MVLFPQFRFEKTAIRQGTFVMVENMQICTLCGVMHIHSILYRVACTDGHVVSYMQDY